MLKTPYILLAYYIIIASCRPALNSTPSTYDKLKHFYKDTSISGIFIFPDTIYDESRYLFRGSQIDSATFTYLPPKVTRGLPWTEGFYGTYSFSINAQYSGLLTRVPGEYSSTAIQLWIYDLKNDSISNVVLLSDLFGDAGEILTTCSYLFFENGKYLKALKYSHYSFDHSINDDTDTTIEHHYNYWLLKITPAITDTLSTDSVPLNEKFGKELDQLRGF